MSCGSGYELRLFSVVVLVDFAVLSSAGCAFSLCLAGCRSACVCAGSRCITVITGIVVFVVVVVTVVTVIVVACVCFGAVGLVLGFVDFIIDEVVYVI